MAGLVQIIACRQLEKSGVASWRRRVPRRRRQAEGISLTTPPPPENIRPMHINLWCLEEVLSQVGELCGCPDCCAAAGTTALYTLQDFVPGVYPLSWWAKCVCKEKLAMLCKERIVPGWPGGGVIAHRRPK